MSDITPELKYKMVKAATLLAQSPIRESVRLTLSENVDKMTEADIDQLIVSLEREQGELQHLQNELVQFDNDQDKAWAALAEKQKQAADQLVEEFLKDLN